MAAVLKKPHKTTFNLFFTVNLNALTGELRDAFAEDEVL